MIGKLSNHNSFEIIRESAEDQAVNHKLRSNQAGNKADYNDLDKLYSSNNNAEDQSILGSVLGKIWNIPNTLIGLAWGLIGLPFGAKMSFGNNALQFENHPFM